MTQRPSERARPSPTIRVGVLGLFAAFLLVLPLALAPRAEAFIYWAGAGPSAPPWDRPRQPRRHGRQRELHHRHRHPDARHRGGRRAHLLDELGPGQAQSAAPTSTARPPTTASSPTPATGRKASPSTPTTSTGPRGARPWIARANLDGSGVDRSFITMSDYLGIYERSGVAVDAHHVYWTQIQAPNGSIGIGRANLDGTNVDRSFITGLSQPTDVAVDAEHIYWTATGRPPWSVGRAELDGTDVEPAFIPTAGQPAGRRRRRPATSIGPRSRAHTRRIPAASAAPTSTARA